MKRWVLFFAEVDWVEVRRPEAPPVPALGNAGAALLALGLLATASLAVTAAKARRTEAPGVDPSFPSGTPVARPPPSQRSDPPNQVCFPRQ